MADNLQSGSVTETEIDLMLRHRQTHLLHLIIHMKKPVFCSDGTLCSQYLKDLTYEHQTLRWFSTWITHVRSLSKFCTVVTSNKLFPISVTV